MSRLFTFAAAGALAACIGAMAWSQNAQSGGAGTAGASGGAGVSGSAGAAGTAGQAGAAANAGAAGQAGAQVQNPSNVPGQQQFISPRPTGNNFNFNDPLRRPFFMDPGARRELNMTNRQFDQLQQSYQAAWLQHQNRLAQLNANANLTPQQRAAQMQQLQAHFNQQFGQMVDTTFTDPRLRRRFNQLDWQFRPFSAFSDATVSRQLQLTPQQQRDLRELGSRWRQQMQRLRRAGANAANDPQAANEQFAAMQLQFQQQMRQIMTPQQWQAWTQLTGRQFNFPQTAFFPDDDINPRFAVRPDGNVGVTRGTPLDSQQRPVNGSQNGTQNNNQNDNDNDAAQNGNVGATQGTPFD
jgi:hypothetical protein